jgi:acetyl esterase/lipase
MIIGVNYRLLPESNGIDIMQDVADFWEWLPTKLPEYLQSSAPSIEADLSKVIAYGDSAGGYLAIYSGFTQTGVSINAVIAMYPVIDPRAIRGNQEYPPSALDNHIRAMELGKIVTSVFPPERLELGPLLAQENRMMEFFGVHESLLQMKSVEEVPYLLILHGDVDPVIPVQGSIRFKEEAERFGIRNVALRIKRGGEHGFDKETALETPWLAEALKKVTKLWLK